MWKEFATVLIGFSPGLLCAQELTSARVAAPSMVVSETAAVTVLIRTVEAQGRIDEEDGAGQPIPIRIDSRLEDLADKLKRLPFRGFSMLESERRTIALRKKENLSLINGQTLLLRPLYCADGKTGMWLRWQDRSGQEILDTRLHLDSGESMLAGTDLLNNPKNGLLLAIEVNPVTP